MLYSAIFKKYFPLRKVEYAKISDNDRNIIIGWLRDFYLDVKRYEYQKVKTGYKNIWTVDIDRLQLGCVANNFMFKQQINQEELVIINIVIYAHKYNRLIYKFKKSIMTPDVVKKYFD